MVAPPEYLSTVLPLPLTPPEHASERPWVTLTYAQSLDARIAGVGGKQLILSGKESMLMTHWYRLFSVMPGYVFIYETGCVRCTTRF